jgi:hypothetical protein
MPAPSVISDPLFVTVSFSLSPSYFLLLKYTMARWLVGASGNYVLSWWLAENSFAMQVALLIQWSAVLLESFANNSLY